MIQSIILTKKWVAAGLPKRPKDANKGTFGKVLVIAGSKNYPGAAYLSCAAAYRVGAGLVTLSTESGVKIIVSRKLPEVTFLSHNDILRKIDEYDVLLIGPGLGQSDQVKALMEELCINYSNNRYKIVIDGDGLNLLSKIDNWWRKLNGKVILTPHPGEMSRLTGLSVDEIQKNRAEIAKKYASDIWGQVVVLKGAETVIVSPGGEVMVSPFANPVLATAGTGDVLSGIITGFLAQGVVNNCGFNAAAIGVYIHGLAGEQLKEKYGQGGALASELLPLLPKIIQHIRKENQKD